MSKFIYEKLQEARHFVSYIINNKKNGCNGYLASNLNNPKTNIKTDWSILNTFCSGKKILIIPPLLMNNEVVSDFKTKSNLLEIRLPEA